MPNSKSHRSATPHDTGPSARHRPASSWRVVLSLFFITSVIESMSMSHVFAFLPVYLQGMHVPHVETWVGVLTALTFVTGLPLVPLWGIWAQRVGGKAVIARSAFVEMVVFLLLGWSHALFGVFVAMLLVGFQLGNTGIMLAALRQAAPSGRVGFAVSVFSVASTVGMAGGPLVGGIVTALHLLNLHGLFALDGLLSLLTGTMLLVFYRDPHKYAPAEHTSDAPQVSAWTAAWQSVRFTFSLRVTWLLFGIYTMLMMARQMVTPYLPIAIERLPLHALSTTATIGGLMGLSAVAGAVITIAAGRLGDKFGFARLLTIALIGSLPAVVLLGLLQSPVWFAVSLTVFSAGYGSGSAMVFALFSTQIPASHRSTALNLVYLPLYVGGIVGPAAAAGLTHIGLFAPFAAAGLLFGLGIFITTVMRRSSLRPSTVHQSEFTTSS